MSKIELPESVYSILNLPKSVLGGNAYINSQGEIFTFKDSIDNKTIIHNLGFTIENDAFWYDGGIFFRDTKDSQLFRFDMVSKKSEPYNNIIVYEGNRRQTFGIAYNYLFYSKGTSEQFIQVDLKTGKEVKSENHEAVYTIHVFCDKVLFWYQGNGADYHSFRQVSQTGECKEIFLQKAGSGDYLDWNNFITGTGMGMFRTRNSKTIVDIMDSKVTNQIDKIAKRSKMFHPVLGYTMYPEYCEKFSKYYQKFQDNLYPEQVKDDKQSETKKVVEVLQIPKQPECVTDPKEQLEKQKIEKRLEILKKLYIEDQCVVDEVLLKTIIETLPDVKRFNELEKLDEEYIPFIVEELAKQPKLLHGKKSEFFTLKVATYLKYDIHTSQQQKEDFCLVYGIDQCAGFSKEAKQEIQEIVNEFLIQIEKNQTQIQFKDLLQEQIDLLKRQFTQQTQLIIQQQEEQITKLRNEIMRNIE